MAVLVLGGLLLADVVAMDTAETRLGPFASGASDQPEVPRLQIHRNLSQEQALFVASVVADPGDTVSLFVPRTPGGPLGDYVFQAVPLGQWHRFRGGGSPDVILHEEAGPPDPFSLPPGDLLEIAPTRIVVPENQGIGSGGVDLVWRFSYDQPPPEDPAARAVFDAWVQDLLRGMGTEMLLHRSVHVTTAWAAPTHQGLLAAVAVAVVAAVLSGSLWLRGMILRGWGDPATSGTEQRLGPGEIWGRHLSFQRALLGGLSVPLAYTAWGTTAAFRGWTRDLAGPEQGWSQPLVWGMAAFWVLVLVAWIAHLIRVHRALGAWRARTPEPPLDR